MQITLREVSRPAPALSRKRIHIAVAAFASLAVALGVALILFHGYIAWLLAYPYVAPLSSNPQEAIGLDYEDVLFSSASDSSTVSGWYIPANSGELASAGGQSAKTVVFSHGYGTNREEEWVPMYGLTRLLHAMNYNVLLFDYGYASQHYKHPATGGREESAQLQAAVDYVRSRGANDVIVWGFSMGAGTALQTALSYDGIDAMILDSLFVPAPEALFDNLSQYVPLPRFPSLPLIESMLPLWTGYSFGSVPIGQVMAADYGMPVYITHGTHDDKASPGVAEAISSRQSDALSRSWIVEHGRHELLFRQHPEQYIQRAALFLSQVEQQLQGRPPVE